MGYQIIKQPNGKFCIFSSFSDDFILTDATEKEIYAFFDRRARERVRIDVYDIMRSIELGNKPYHQFTMTYEEALEKHNKTNQLEGDDDE